MQFFIREDTDGAFFSFPTKRLAAPNWCAAPFVQAVVDDVHYPATTPPGPGDAPRRIDNSLVRHVEFDCEFFEHRAPEPFDLLRGAALQLFETADAVAIHELFQPALCNAIIAWPSIDIAAYLKLSYRFPPVLNSMSFYLSS